MRAHNWRLIQPPKDFVNLRGFYECSLCGISTTSPAREPITAAAGCPVDSTRDGASGATPLRRQREGYMRHQLDQFEAQHPGYIRNSKYCEKYGVNRHTLSSLYNQRLLPCLKVHGWMLVKDAPLEELKNEARRKNSAGESVVMVV